MNVTRLIHSRATLPAEQGTRPNPASSQSGFLTALRSAVSGSRPAKPAAPAAASAKAASQTTPAAASGASRTGPAVLASASGAVDAAKPKPAFPWAPAAAQRMASAEAAETAAATPSIAPLGTPNSEIKRGQLMEMGSGVYYNTGNGTYQDLKGTVVGTNPNAVRQYTDPVGYFYSGAAFEPSDTFLRETVPNMEELVPARDGSATVILNARWAYDTAHGGPPDGSTGGPAYPRQTEPVPLMAYQGVLKAPGRPPLEGKCPPWNYQIGSPDDSASV